MKKIVVLQGLIGSGKDTAANFIIQKGNAVKLSFASILKDVVSAVFGWNRKALEGDTSESRVWREQIDEWWAKRLNIPDLSPRWVLQQWGTNLLRNHFHPDIWIAAIERKIYDTSVDTIVITDCRFTNEIEFLIRLRKESGFDVKFVWIRRPPLPHWVEVYLKEGIPPFGVHLSEYQWLHNKFDIILDNDSDFETLKNEVLKV